MLFFSVVLFVQCTAKEFNLAAAQYVVVTEDEEGKWANYLTKHLKKRLAVEQQDIISLQHQAEESKNNTRIIQLAVVAGIAVDYSIERTAQKIVIQAKNEAIALWLVYQLISEIAEQDTRFNAWDLPPATVSFTQPKQGALAFDYREVHLAPQLKADYAAVIGGHNLEEAWGIWGHNLLKITEEEREESMYASLSGLRQWGQLSFASSKLYERIEAYIVDNFGEGNEVSTRFMIMPQDNDVVCLCEDCVALGNTKDNATPAVTHLLNRLAKRFPNHLFFTTAYRTTKLPPKGKLAENVGVMISTIDLPKGVALTAGHQQEVLAFERVVKEWKSKTQHIYLWDYIANFDDYLTPLPVLLGAQKQLTYFKKLGVNGVFYNGGGYDYMPFDDVKTFVLNALLQDVTHDVSLLIRKFYDLKYPVTGKLLADYYLQLELDYAAKNRPYPLYGGFQEINGVYLNAENFINFYKALEQQVAKTAGEERMQVNKLITALSYTRLQIAYTLQNQSQQWRATVEEHTANKKQATQWVSKLKAYRNYDDLIRYKEDGGALKDYTQAWERLLQEPLRENLLAKASLVTSTVLKEEQENWWRLTDGLPGFEEDYHQGWVILTKNTTEIAYEALAVKGKVELKMSFLLLDRHRFYAPQGVEVYVDEQRVAFITLPELAIVGQRAILRLPLDLTNKKQLKLRFLKQPKARGQIALDEIDVSQKI